MGHDAVGSFYLLTLGAFHWQDSCAGKGYFADKNSYADTARIVLIAMINVLSLKPTRDITD